MAQGEDKTPVVESVRTQAEVFEASNGAEANTVNGKPIVLLTSVGAKSGKRRKTALMRVEHGGDYAVLSGGSKLPAWHYNLKAHPQVKLQDLAERHDYIAREVSGAERDAWWERAVAAYPPYADYQEKTDRLIPIFVLERTAD